MVPRGTADASRLEKVLKVPDSGLPNAVRELGSARLAETQSLDRKIPSLDKAQKACADESEDAKRMYRTEHGHGRAGFRPSIWRAPAAAAFRRMAGYGSASAHHARQADDGGGGHAGEQDGAHRLTADDGEEGLPGRRPGMREHRDAVGNVRRSDEEQGHYGQQDRSRKTRKPSRAVGLGISILDRIRVSPFRPAGTMNPAERAGQPAALITCLKLIAEPLASRASIDNGLNEHSLNPLGTRSAIRVGGSARTAIRPSRLQSGLASDPAPVRVHDRRFEFAPQSTAWIV